MPSRTTETPYALFQRAGSARWWTRFSITGEGQIRKPLGTTDRAEAERLANEVYSEARYPAKQGLRSQAKSFWQVAEEFTDHIQREAQRGERHQFQADQFKRIIKGYFSDHSPTGRLIICGMPIEGGFGSGAGTTGRPGRVRTSTFLHTSVPAVSSASQSLRRCVSRLPPAPRRAKPWCCGRC